MNIKSFQNHSGLEDFVILVMLCIRDLLGD